MERMKFDEQGKLIGIDNNFINPQLENQGEIKYEKSNSNLSTSQDLLFLKEDNTVYDTSKDSKFWSFYSQEGPLNPIKYSNGKSQEDIVKEVSKLIEEGKKIIFIHGGCGTGKSSIALNLARLFGKSSIVVPVKNLQKQYENDYSNKKYLLNKEGKKMKIAIITGRDNHDSIIEPGTSCSAQFLPDTIAIAEKNRKLLIQYYQDNPLIKNKNAIPMIKLLRRISIAPSNPHWSPIYSSDYVLSQLSDAKKKNYRGVSGKEYIFYHRKPGCSYYDQFQAYINADILVFNSPKYLIEMAFGRKPESALDIIDEADAFLDNLSKQETLDLSNLYSSLNYIYPESRFDEDNLQKIKELISLEIKNKKSLGINEDETFPLKSTFTGKALAILLRSNSLKMEISLSETNYSNEALEIALNFEDTFEETFIAYSKKDENIQAHLVTTNVAKKFADICNKTKALILMSGTLHSPEVLKNVFGVKDFAIVEAETKMPGEIELSRLETAFDCSKKYLDIPGNRKKYLLALSECIKKAKRPTLVHVNAFDDLPTSLEIEEYSLFNLPERGLFRSMQAEDKLGLEVQKFKKKEIDILFTTRCSRGVDFPGDMCNSIIFTKYPNPNPKDLFWKILNQTHKAYYWSVYNDRANREFLQRLYRGLRSQDDHVQILSPDARVLNATQRLLAG